MIGKKVKTHLKTTGWCELSTPFQGTSLICSVAHTKLPLTEHTLITTTKTQRMLSVLVSCHSTFDIRLELIVSYIRPRIPLFGLKMSSTSMWWDPAVISQLLQCYDLLNHLIYKSPFPSHTDSKFYLTRCFR